MTDALSKNDAENVLVSLRRLTADRAPVQQPPAMERFLLTPALRVVETPAPAAVVVPPVQRRENVTPISRPARPADEANESVADDAAIARLLRSLARSEAPAVLAETLAKSCDQSVTAAFTPEITPASGHVGNGQGAVLRTEQDAGVVAQSQQPAPTTAASDIPATALADEAFLREIVADVLRQELQGELGERITRNMRKLVRREIHRALSQIDCD